MTRQVRRERSGREPNSAFLRSVVNEVRGDVRRSAAAGLAWQAVAVAVPWTIQRALDDGLVPEDRAALALWVAVLVVLGVVRWVGDATRHWWVERSGALAAASLRRRILTHVLTLDADSAARYAAGDLVGRATTDVRVVWTWVSGLATLVTSSFTLVAVCVVLLTLGPLLAVIGLITVPVAAYIAVRRLGSQQRAARAVADAAGEFTAAMEETLAGIAALKGIGAEASQLARIRKVSSRLQGTAVLQARVEAAWVSAASFVPAAGMAAGLWAGGELALRGDLSVGALVAFAGWMSLLVSAVQTLTYRLATRGEALAAASRIVEVLHTRPVVRAPARPVRLPAGSVVRVDAVTVKREGRTLLDEVHLGVEPGEWLAVAGTTGAGKSTLLRLVPRLADPAAGAIMVAGSDVTTVEPAVLRRRVGYLGQRPTLFAGSVADNLRLGAPHVTDEELWEVLEAVDARTVVDALPGRLAAHVGDRGATLSGGQRQRLALARLLLARPAVLVLDDVTSALDHLTEARILESLRRWAPNSAVLIATHRLQVAAAADRLVVLAHGRVVEDGSPARLLGSGSHAGTLLAAHVSHDAGTDLR